MMQRLGEILIEKGVLSLTELHSALEVCHRTGGRLGTQLLKFGYVEESVLLEALSKQLGVPNVARVKLLHSPLEVRQLLPPAAGRRFLAVPFADTPGGVKVAMANPNDRVAVDEISTHLRKNVLPHVATESAVLHALGGAADDESDWPADAAQATGSGGRNGDVESWNRLWRAPRFDPSAMFRTAEDGDDRDEDVLVASFPDLAPVSDDGHRGLEPVVDDSNFAQLLRAADHRDGIGAVLARFAASEFGRACLFAVHKQIVSGWMARGRSVVLEDLQSFSVPVGEPSVFADVGHAESYVGEILDNPANRELVRAMADPAPVEVVAVPIRVKQREVAFLVCDNPGLPLESERIGDLVHACRKAGVAFEVLILRKKLLA